MSAPGSTLSFLCWSPIAYHAAAAATSAAAAATTALLPNGLPSPTTATAAAIFAAATVATTNHNAHRATASRSEPAEATRPVAAASRAYRERHGVGACGHEPRCSGYSRSAVGRPRLRVPRDPLSHEVHLQGREVGRRRACRGEIATRGRLL